MNVLFFRLTVLKYGAKHTEQKLTCPQCEYLQSADSVSGPTVEESILFVSSIFFITNHDSINKLPCLLVAFYQEQRSDYMHSTGRR